MMAGVTPPDEPAAEVAPGPPAVAAARVLVQALVALGVEDVVLAPGSRSAPLAYALAEAALPDDARPPGAPRCACTCASTSGRPRSWRSACRVRRRSRRTRVRGPWLW